MPPKVVVLIQEDPYKSHRAVEGIRIALGLSTGPNPLNIVLIDQARSLISPDAEDIVDGDIWEKYLPVVQEQEIPIIVPEGSSAECEFDTDFNVQESSTSEISSLIGNAERILIF